MNAPLDLLGLPMPALSDALETLGVGAKHAGRVFGALHRRGLAFNAIPDLGWRNHALLEAGARLAQATVAEVWPSPDGTEKLVFALDTDERVEGVLIPMREGRLTLCLSSQVGCAMACTFCATGTMGLSRGLTSGEIVAQVHAANAHAQQRGAKITHLVFMGMGEPLHHYPATRDALRVLLDPHGLCFKARRITVSTVGVVPKMLTFARDFDGRVQLALSLHAGTDETRRSIVPVAGKSWDLATLKAAMAAYPQRGSRCLMVEYVVLPGINNTDAEVAGLIDFVKDLRCIVNLIPFNPFPGATYRAPLDAELEAMAQQLYDAGVAHSVRWPRGRGAAAACGQLALRQPE
jgi:23S rRNA (adenine2503-C2)-methyltransferase